jgi:predicted transposase YbfD/YdcC
MKEKKGIAFLDYFGIGERNESKMDSFKDYFGDIEDHRSSRNQLYSVDEILFAALAASVAGAESWNDTELFAKTHLDLLREYLPYANGVPSDDTFRRFFRGLNPSKFQEKFRNWMSANLSQTEEGVIAIDGKTSRGSTEKTGEEKRTLHLVSAYSTEANLVLAQEKVADKSNEITAIPTLLDWLDLRKATVTIDAMGCQYKIADKIIEHGGQYVLSLKGNQCSLHEDIKTALQDTEILSRCDVFEAVDKGHGRIEERKCMVFKDVAWLKERHEQWKTINSVIRIDSKREISGKVSEETRYYISSKDMPAKKALETIRSHWGIENRVHWILDMSFGEDQSKIRKENAPQNMAIVRHMALNLLRIAKQNNQKYKRVSIKGLRKMAGWNDEVFRFVMSQKFS